MKFLFWGLVILFVWWAWRRARSSPSRQAPPPAAPKLQDMVTCKHCGLHLPHDEAVAGVLGQYCSPAHRSAAGDRNPD